jgi:hypothetical protein
MESLATYFWRCLVVDSRKEGCDQVHVYPDGELYRIRLHDHAGWHELDMSGSTVDLPAFIPHLKVLVGRGPAADIPAPGAKYTFQLAPRNQIEVTVTTNRTGSGGEDVHIYLLLEPEWMRGSGSAA